MYQNLAGKELDEWASARGIKRYQGFLSADTDAEFKKEIAKQLPESNSTEDEPTLTEVGSKWYSIGKSFRSELPAKEISPRALIAIPFIELENPKYLELVNRIQEVSYLPFSEEKAINLIKHGGLIAISAEILDEQYNKFVNLINAIRDENNVWWEERLRYM